MKINSFRGELTDISAKKEALALTSSTSLDVQLKRLHVIVALARRNSRFERGCVGPFYNIRQFYRPPQTLHKLVEKPQLTHAVWKSTLIP